MRLFLLLTSVVMVQGLRLHSFFSPGMMMQRDVPTKVWGFDLVGSLDAELSCQVEGRVVTHRLPDVRSMDGVWEAELPPQAAATICDFQAISETEEIALTDIMFGDMWFCSGQSNMEMAMEYIMNSTEEIEASASFTSIRFAVIKNSVSAVADFEADLPLEQSWSDPSDSESLRWMSAVCFLFARSLQQLWKEAGQEVVPLGLVDSDWSGTQVEGWSTPHSLESCSATIECDDNWPQFCCDFNPQFCPSHLYNGMVVPLARVALKGFLWYQGEGNGGTNRDLYNCTFPAMIDDWRELFSTNSNTAPDAPFGFVQLASYRPDSVQAAWPVIRWHQTADYCFTPNERLQNVFMASPLDTYDDKQGFPGGVHSRYKQIVGERLAVAGMFVAYGIQNQGYRPFGPLPDSVQLDVDNQIATVHYLEEIVYDNTEISRFYVCEDDPVSCDSGSSLANWVEVGKEAAAQVDKFTLSINLELPGVPFSLAYAWRETPVKRYLGLPVYGSQEQFRLPSPPWKMLCGADACNFFKSNN